MGVTIRFNAAACDLAKVIYYARAKAYALDCTLWDVLPPQMKALYVSQAQDILMANRPYEPDAPIRSGFVSIERQPAEVVGTITPSEPWGRTR